MCTCANNLFSAFYSYLFSTAILNWLRNAKKKNVSGKTQDYRNQLEACQILAECA